MRPEHAPGLPRTSRGPPLSFPRPPSVIPAVFSGNPQVGSLHTAETQTAGFPINNVGNDRKRATPFHSCCERSSSGRAVLPAPPCHARPCSSRPFLAFPPLRSFPRPILSFPHSPSVIPAVFSGNPQVGPLPTAETQTAGFPIKDVGNDRKRAVPFHSCCGRSSSGRAILPVPPCHARPCSSRPSLAFPPLRSFPPPILSFLHSPSVIPAAPPLSFPQFLAGIHKWDRCRRRKRKRLDSR